MHISRFAAATSAVVFFGAQAAVQEAQAPDAPDDAIAALCAEIIKDKSELMEPCTMAQREAQAFVMSWFGANGLLDSDGNVDSLQLLEAQSDPLSGLNNSAASAAVLCIDATSDWIGMSECVATLDQNAQFGGGQGGFDPLLGGPTDGLPDDPLAPFPGVN